MPTLDSAAAPADADAVQADVRRLYEALPYPLPVADLEAYRAHRTTIDGSPHYYNAMFWPRAAPRDDLDVLVAGCGTSQAALLALQHPRARVVGIDLSEASLRCTSDLAAKYGLENLTLRRHPIERVGELAGELDVAFDLVLSTGVLHHLPDPDAGLRALRGVLRPDGAMHLMVYAAHGRCGVVMMQEYCRRLGIAPERAELADLHDLVRGMPADHPLGIFARRGGADLGHPNGLADALLHPCDHPFTVPAVHDWLARCGMVHVRWFLQAPYLPHCGFAARSRHAARLAARPAAEQHAAMELLRGTMITHTFVAVRDDRPPATYAVDLGRDDWLEHVPVPFVGSALVADDPPAGATAILRHRSHRDPDLALPVDTDQEAMFRGVDGRRTIAAIAAHAGRRPDESVRAYFTALWRHDLVLLRLS
jgi:SAM-dependent methyltransferase